MTGIGEDLMDNKRKNGSMQRRVELVNNRNNRRSSRAGSVNYIRNSQRSSGAENRPRRPMTEADRRRRLEEMRKKHRRRTARLRATAILFIAAAAAAVLLFMTPAFNIRQIELEGNNAVTKEQIQDKIGSLIGANLFRTSSENIRELMLEIPQIDDVTVSKTLFPPSVKVTISECSPAAYMLSSNKIIVINSELKVIDDSGFFSTDSIPSISGMSIHSYTLNERLSSDSAEKEDVLSVMLSTFESTGLLSKVTYISLDDLSNIKFNYDNRIECECGSSLEMERKIRMFAETLSSDSMDANSMGSMDLSTPGQAVYVP